MLENSESALSGYLLGDSADQATRITSGWLAGGTGVHRDRQAGPLRQLTTERGGNDFDARRLLRPEYACKLFTKRLKAERLPGGDCDRTQNDSRGFKQHNDWNDSADHVVEPAVKLGQRNRVAFLRCGYQVLWGDCRPVALREFDGETFDR